MAKDTRYIKIANGWRDAAAAAPATFSQDNNNHALWCLKVESKQEKIFMPILALFYSSTIKCEQTRQAAAAKLGTIMVVVTSWSVRPFLPSGY